MRDSGSDITNPVISKTLFKQLYSIQGLLILFLCIQCVGITNPPLEIGHNWRQTLTAMIARNLQIDGFNLLYPKVDFTGNNSGILGSEFPIFQGFIAVFNSIFGYTHWAGRPINLVISTWGAWSFYRFLQYAFSQRLALNATGILLFSVWFSFSRKIMPDSFSISLMLIGLRQIQLFWITNQFLKLLIAIVFIASGILCKLPAIAWVFALGSLIPCLSYTSENPQITNQKIALIFAATILAALPGVVWYFYWVPELNRNFQLFYPKSLAEGWLELIPNWRLLLEKFYFTAFYSFIALFLLIIGITHIKKLNNKTELSEFDLGNSNHTTNKITLIAFKYGLICFLIVFAFFIIKTGDVFPKHTYYILPAMPMLAIVAAFGIEKTILHFDTSNNKNQTTNTVSALILLAVIIEGFLNQMHELKIKPSEWYKLELEEIAKFIPKKALVISNAGVNPQELYFLGNKGWVRFPEQIINQNHLDSLKNQQARFLVLNKNLQPKSDSLSIKKCYNSKNFVVYDLSPQ